MTSKIKPNWKHVSGAGSHRSMFRQLLKLTILECLQALEELYKTANKLTSIKTRNNQQSFNFLPSPQNLSRGLAQTLSYY